MKSAAEPLAVQKFVGTGNDFVFIDARVPRTAKSGESDLGLNRPQLAERICDRHFGVGADGLVFVEESEGSGRLKWDFYNSDGSSAEMCGNASRCMGRWGFLNLGVQQFEFDTVVGTVRVSAQGELVCSELSFVSAEVSSLEFGDGEAQGKASLVNTGVPHAVVIVSDISRVTKQHPAIQGLRYHPATGPKGTNVTFLETTGVASYKTVTFERGVEDFTLSCGTGVLAAAAVGLLGEINKNRFVARELHDDRKASLNARLETPGGKLRVEYGEGFKGAKLVGPADLVFSTQLGSEFFRS